MEKIKKILIGGEKQVGKTFLVQRLVSELRNRGKQIKGYCTYMQRDIIDKANNGFNIYMHPACVAIENRKETEENCIGSSNGKERIINEKIFADLGVRLLANIKKDDVVIMDEIGFFEADVKEFTDKVCELIENENTVIAVVKEKYDNEYINKVRAYKDREDTIFVQVTEESREEVFTELEKIVKEW